METAYKVVKVVRKHDGKEEMWSVSSCWKLQYYFDVAISPTMKFSKLFVFKEKQDAIDWADSVSYTLGHDHFVCECSVPNLVPARICAMQDCDLVDFWTNNLHRNLVGHPPRGSYFTDSITINKVVWIA